MLLDINFIKASKPGAKATKLIKQKAQALQTVS